MAKRCFRKKDWCVETHLTTANNPELAQKRKRKVQGVPQLQTADLPKTDKSKQAQIEQTYEKH